MQAQLSTLFLILVMTAWSPWAAAQTPVSVIHVSDYPACLSPSTQPIEVQLSTDSVSITGWWWDLGNGRQSTLPSPLAEYDEPNTYDVTLTIDTMSFGPVTIVERNLIQVNQLLVEDDFGLSGQSNDIWHDFDPSLLVGSALEFEVQVAGDHLTRGEQNGEIICLNGGNHPGTGLAGVWSSGRFFFDLELITEDPRAVTYTAFRLLGSGAGSQRLADLRVRRIGTRFEIRLESSSGGTGDWHPLVQTNPVLKVGLDWYEGAGGNGGLKLKIQEDYEPAVIQELLPTGQQGLAIVQLGVMSLLWPDDGTSAGKMRVDNFRFCDYSHRPDTE